MNPDKQGTKVAAHYRVKVAPGQSATVRLRLTSAAPAGESRKSKAAASPFGPEFDKTLAARLQEADEFYRSVTPPSVSPDAANVMRQAIAGMLWSKQFFFFDGDNWLDEHHSNPLHAGYRNARNSEWFHMLNEDIISMPDKWEYPWYAAWDLAFHTLPLCDRGPRLRQGADETDAQGRLPAPQRPDARLRVELQRREPPGPRLCDALPAPHRAGPARRDGPRFPQGDVQQAAAELHLVGEPQGPLRQERLRGGLPRPRQHRRLRPQRPAAHRRPPRAGRRHGLDGPFQPEHDGARRGARRPRPHLRGHGREVRRAFLLHRRGHEPVRSGRHVGRGGRLLLRRAAAPRRQRHAAQGALHGGAAAPVRHDGHRKVAAGAHPAGAGSHCRNGCAGYPNFRTTMHPTGPGHFGVADRGIIALVNPERLRRILTKMLDENEFLGPCGIRSLSKFHEQQPVYLPRERPGVQGGLPAGRVEHGHVRRQLQLAGTGLDAGERAHHPGAAELLPLLRRQLQNRMPHGFRQDDEPLRGGEGDLGPPDRHLSPR